MDVVFRASFAYLTETCTVFKRAALDVMFAHFFFSYISFSNFLITAFSASVGAGRMILRTDLIFLSY